MASFGHIEEFLVTKNESWEEYIERLNFYFIANNISEENKKRAVLLSVCGSSTYSLIRSLASPAALTDCTYDQIVQKVKEHINPRPSIIMQRFQFHKRDQKSTESVAEYITELKKIAEHCQFGVVLQDMLRDRLVCGVKDETVQRRLLAEPELTFEVAKVKALAAEAAQQHTAEIRAATTEVHKMRTSTEDKKQRTKLTAKSCYRCGGEHTSAACKFVDLHCRFCKKRGHIERMCFQKKGAVKGNHNSLLIEEEGSEENIDVGEFSVNQVKSVVDPISIEVKLAGRKHAMEVDSGSPFTIISNETFNRLWPLSKPIVKDCNIKMRSYTQQSLKMKGKIDVMVEFKRRKAKLSLLITEGTGTSLIGRTWFRPLGIELRGVNYMKNVQKDIDDIINKNVEVFSRCIG